MQRFLTVSLGVLALSVGVFVMGYQGSAQAANPPLDQILAAITQLQTSVNNLQTQVNGLQTQVNGLQTQVNGLQTQVNGLPTTQVDLHGVTQNWDKNLPSASRFTVLTAFNNQAVRDNNTGLVWEQAPDAATRTWEAATLYCVNKNVGGTRGWRLPSVAELASLIDPSLSAPFVPASIFTDVQSAVGYWSAATRAGTPTSAWTVFFVNGQVTIISITFTNLNYAWCVRGPMQESVY